MKKKDGKTLEKVRKESVLYQLLPAIPEIGIKEVRLGKILVVNSAFNKRYYG